MHAADARSLLYERGNVAWFSNAALSNAAVNPLRMPKPDGLKNLRPPLAHGCGSGLARF
jgi:hypothetical protein